MRRLQYLIGAIAFVDAMFYAAVAPLLPELTDQFELDKTGAGVLMGAAAIGTLLGSLPGGWLISRVGVKSTVLVGLVLMTLASAAFAFGSSIAVLDVGRFLQGLGAACSWAGGLAWLVAAAPRERRGAVIGAALGVAIFGVQFGPVLGGVASAIGREAAFSFPVVLGLALTVWAWTTPAPPQPEQARVTPLRDLRIQAGIWMTLISGLAVGVTDVLLPLRLDAFGASALAISAVFFLAAGTAGLAGPLTGRLSDRRGTLPVARAALVSGVVGLVAMQLPGSAWLLGVVAVGTLTVLMALWVPSTALLADGAERVSLDQGYAFAFFNFAWAGGVAIGSTAGGALAQVSSDAVPYLLAAAAYAATAVVVMAGRPRLRGSVRSGSTAV